MVRNGRVIPVFVPAFPSYVFVAARNCWEHIRELTGIVGFVKFGRLIAEVPVADVEALAAKATADLVLPQDDPPSKFAKGQKVSVSSGAFSGPAVYDRPTSPGRAMVLVDILGRLTPVSVDEDHISKLQVLRRARHHRPRRGHRYSC
jgi:transcription antitermination factor NusG